MILDEETIKKSQIIGLDLTVNKTSEITSGYLHLEKINEESNILKVFVSKKNSENYFE